MASVSCVDVVREVFDVVRVMWVPLLVMLVFVASRCPCAAPPPCVERRSVHVQTTTTEGDDGLQVRRRTVLVQGPSTYKFWWKKPEFRALAVQEHGAWPEG